MKEPVEAQLETKKEHLDRLSKIKPKELFISDMLREATPTVDDYGGVILDRDWEPEHLKRREGTIEDYIKAKYGIS